MVELLDRQNLALQESMKEMEEWMEKIQTKETERDVLLSGIKKDVEDIQEMIPKVKFNARLILNQCVLRCSRNRNRHK